MKKNKLMRLASILLVVTLLSTCAISGTFAKYVTKAEGQDSARVAKWGIVVDVQGNSVFETTYKTDDKNGYEGENSVVSSGAIKEISDVVAPGTKGEALKATVKGTPEVATRYTLTIKDWNDIVLPKGTYTDYTELKLGEDGYSYSGTFTTDAAYSPVKWDITVTKADGTKIGLLNTATRMLDSVDGFNGFSASEAKEIMKTYKTQLESLLETVIPSGQNAKVDVAEDGTITLSMDFDPNKEMNYTFELTWNWAFEGPTYTITAPGAVTTFDKTLADQADTYLGNLIAEVKDIVVPEGASTTIAATVTATATQID